MKTIVRRVFNAMEPLIKDQENGKYKCRRMGKVRIDFDIIDNDPDLAKEMLSGCVVLRAEAMIECRAIEYLLLNDEFQETFFGCTAPFYIPEFNSYPVTDPETGDVIGRRNKFNRWVSASGGVWSNGS